LATNAIIGSTIDAALAADIPEGGEALSHPGLIEGEVVPGPAEGGGFLDRPLAGALADHSMQQSVGLEYEPGGEVAASEGSGLLTVNGHPISVAKYMPGHDYAQVLSGGELDAGDGLSLMGQAMIKAAPSAAERDGFEQSPEAGARYEGSREGEGAPGRTEGTTAGARGFQDERGLEPDRATGTGTPVSTHHKAAVARSDLEFQHKVELEEALRRQDVGETTSEVSVGGKTLSVTTSFEARDPDTNEEVKKGHEHVHQALTSTRNDTQLDAKNIHMRTLIEDRDDVGLSMAP